MLPTENRVTVEAAAVIWEDVRATVPLGDGRMKHGTICMAGYWKGWFTQVQLDEFNRRIQKLIRAARKAQKVAA